MYCKCSYCCRTGRVLYGISTACSLCQVLERLTSGSSKTLHNKHTKSETILTHNRAVAWSCEFFFLNQLLTSMATLCHAIIALLNCILYICHYSLCIIAIVSIVQTIVMLPTFASLMGHKSSLVDTCKSSRVLVVSPIVAFMF